MPLLPTWLRIVWVVALCAVVVVHVGHAWAMPGQRRGWHIGHTVMAAGMTVMYALPHMHHSGLSRAGLVMFAMLAIAVIGIAVLVRRREGTFNPLWVLLAGDMVVMVYMLLPASLKASGLSYVLVAYLGAQVVAWAFGLWKRLPVFRQPVRASSAAVRARVSDAGDEGRGPALLPADPHPEASTGPVVGWTTHSSVAAHASPAVIAASMAYMVAVM